jgi:hypothetical protein
VLRSENTRVSVLFRDRDFSRIDDLSDDKGREKLIAKYEDRLNFRCDRRRDWVDTFGGFLNLLLRTCALIAYFLKVTVFSC